MNSPLRASIMWWCTKNDEHQVCQSDLLLSYRRKKNMRYLSDDDLNHFDPHGLYHDIVFQVTFIPTSPPMEETKARDFFQERHFSIG